MDINRGSMNALFTAVKAALALGLAMASLPAAEIAMEVKSSTKIENYPMTKLLSSMREWVGPRKVQDLKSELLAVVNGDFEHTIGIDRNDFEDDQMGLYTPMFQMMGQDANNLWGRLIKNAMVANGDWLDGEAFFGASRTYGNNTIANYVTTALSETTFNTAYEAMMSYQNHADQAIGVVPDTLIVGPTNRTVAHGIVNQGPGATAANPNAGLVKVIVHPLLVGTYANYWFLGQFNGVVKPILLQKRKVGALTRMDSETAACVFEKNENQYGLHYRGAAALALPHLLYAGFKS